jgi:hypothetical protein
MLEEQKWGKEGVDLGTNFAFFVVFIGDIHNPSNQRNNKCL